MSEADMIEPNRDTSEDVLVRLKQGSYERFHLQLINDIDQLLSEFEMSWDDLAERLTLKRTGIELKKYLGGCPLSMEELNSVAAIFSAEPYILFRPRFPWIQN